MRRWLSVLFIVVCATSCSFLWIGLHYIDWLVVREVAQTFNLTSTQKRELQRVVKSHLPWLRQELSPRLLLALNELNVRWLNGIDERDAQWFFDRTRSLRVELAEHMIEDLAPIATVIKPDQLGYAAKKFGKKNEKWSDLLELTDQKLEYKRRQMLRESAENWYGEITELQEDALCTIFGCRRSDIVRMLEYSLDWQGGLLGLLRDVSEPKVFNEIVKTWSREPVLMLPPLKRNTWLQYQNDGPKRLANFDLLMSEAQRANARKKLQKYSDDLAWFVAQVD